MIILFSPILLYGCGIWEMFTTHLAACKKKEKE